MLSHADHALPSPFQWLGPLGAPLPAGIFAAGHPSQQWPPLGVPEGLSGFPRCPSLELRRMRRSVQVRDKETYGLSRLCSSPKKIGKVQRTIMIHLFGTILFFHFFDD